MFAVIAGLLVAIVSCNGQSTPGDTCTTSAFNPCVSYLNSSLSSLTGSISSKAPIVPVGVLTNDTVAVICGDKQSMEKFYVCARNQIVSCLPSQFESVFPSADRMTDSISFLCSNIKDIDLDCVRTKTTDAMPCVLAALPKMPTDMTSLNVDEYVGYMCRMETSMESCYKKAMATCPGRTDELMTEYMIYATPAACDGNIDRVSSLVIVVSLCYTFFKNIV